MGKEIGITSAFAILTGLFFLVEGVWGMFSTTVLGVFTTNHLHATIHIVLGVLGVYMGYMDRPLTYCIFIGLLLLMVGIFHFIPATTPITNVPNVNNATAYVNICIGIASLIMCMFVPPPLD